MRIVVTEKGNEVLRGDSVSPIVIKPNLFQMTPNVKIIKSNSINTYSEYNRNELERVTPKYKNISISIREIYGDTIKNMFNRPNVKKDFVIKQSGHSPIHGKEMINNLKSLANSIKTNDSKNFDQIVKKDAVSPIFLKKLGIFNQNKINTIKKIEKIKIEKLVSNYKYNVIKS
jgi:hypothetical protein